MDGIVYLWKAGGRVIAHTDLEAAARLDGLSGTPDKQITEAEFEASGGLARLIDGKIFLGKTKEEKVAEEARERTAQIDLELNMIDQNSRRASRACVHAQAKGERPDDQDIAVLVKYEEAAAALRDERCCLLAKPLKS